MRKVAFCVWMMHRAVEICENGNLLLTREEALEFQQCIQNHLRAYQYLAMNHGVVNASLFKIKPKAHFLYHTGEQTGKWKINPFCFHCFDEESWLGRAKRVARLCHGRTMSHRFLNRYLICLALFLENHRRQVKSLGLGTKAS